MSYEAEKALKKRLETLKKPIRPKTYDEEMLHRSRIARRKQADFKQSKKQAEFKDKETLQKTF